MQKSVASVVAIVLIVGGALVHGAVTQRWAVFAPDPARTARLHALEVRFEDWQPKDVPTEMPTNERSIASSRSYSSLRNGHTAVVTIISGIPGSVATHTPDVCYVGSGYKTLRAARKEALELPSGQTVNYYSADFEKKTASKVDRIRIRWAWSTDGTWIAPDNPRWQFAKQLNSVPELYKLYIATPLPESEEEERVPQDDGPTKAFILATWLQYSAAFSGNG